MGEKRLVCDSCGTVTERCDSCGKYFDKLDRVVCYENEYHFCNNNCLLEFLIEMGLKVDSVIIEEDDED